MTEIDTSRERVVRLISEMVTWPGQGVYAADLMGALLRRAEKAEAQLKVIEEWGTEDINAAVELRQKLAQTLVELNAAKAERDTAWNDAIEAAANRIHQHIAEVQPEMTRRAQRLAEKKEPGFNYAIHRADLDARISCRDQVRSLKKGGKP